MADILFLVERLEQVLSQGWRVPFTTNAVIDEDALIDVIEQMHIAIPNEIRQAQGIVQQKDRLLAEAQANADRLLEEARGEAHRRVTETDIVAQAEQQAAQIIAEAEAEAEEIRGGADGYATDVLRRIRDELGVYLRQIDNGLAQLQPPAPPAPRATFFDDDEEDDPTFFAADDEAPTPTEDVATR